LKLAVTYNVKNDDGENASQTGVSANAAKYINRNLVENYPERLDDTYAEWDSMETIDAIKSAFESAGHSVELVEGNEDAYEKLKNLKPDFVFNVAEGFNGASRESQIPSMLEMLGIPFTGSDSITIGICHDKSRCKEILSYYNIPNSKFFITDSPVKNDSGFKYPKFVKPLHEGSSKGIYDSSLVKNLEELNNEINRIKSSYRQPALVEDFIPGKEFTVAMLGNGDDLRVLPIVEINLDSVPEGFNKIYSYEVKWFFDTKENQLDIFKCPADVEKSIYEHIEQVCKDTFRVLRIKDWARIDVRLDENNVPNVIEINPLPGILPDPADNSCYPKAARHAGMDYNAVLNSVLNEAIKRYTKE